MLTEYIQAAMCTAHYELIENGGEPYYGGIPACQGVWSTGARHSKPRVKRFAKSWKSGYSGVPAPASTSRPSMVWTSSRRHCS
jgi:hypothetical protein